MLPPIFRTFFARRKPAPKRCTDQNINELMGRIITRTQLPTLDAIARSGEGCCTGDCKQGRDCPHRETKHD